MCVCGGGGMYVISRALFHETIKHGCVQLVKDSFLFPFRALSFGQPIDPPERDNPAEKLYRCLLPNLPQYMIALLKVLLAAAPTSRSRNDSLNILVDVLPPEAPANVVESTQVQYVIEYNIIAKDYRDVRTTSMHICLTNTVPCLHFSYRRCDDTERM